MNYSRLSRHYEDKMMQQESHVNYNLPEMEQMSSHKSKLDMKKQFMSVMTTKAVNEEDHLSDEGDPKDRDQND